MAGGYPVVNYCPLHLHEMWDRGDSYQEMADAIGCSKAFISRLKKRHMLPDRLRKQKETFADDPTPEQIAELAAECRARREEPSEPRGERYSIPRYSWDGKRFTGIV
jgi:hypothetical protein